MKRRSAVFAAVLALAACTRASGPIEIPSEDLPFPVTRSAQSTPSPDAGRELSVYLVRDGRVIAVPRRPDAPQPLATAVLRSLMEGPTKHERARGIGTRIPSGVRVLAVNVTDGDAAIDLSAEFQRPAPPERIALRVAQVVWTITGLEGVRTVSFSIGGEPVSVTTDEGDAVERRLTRDDYAEFAPRD